MQNEEVVVAQGEGQDNNKEKKKFQDGIKRLMGMLNGDESIFKPKVQGGSVPGLIEKLTAKRRLEAEEKFIVQASALLDKKVTFDRTCKQKRDEMEKAIAEQEKTFLKEMNEVFSLIDNFGDIQKSYAATLSKLAGTDVEVIAPAAQA